VIERAGARINSFLGGDGPRLRCRRRPRSCRGVRDAALMRRVMYGVSAAVNGFHCELALSTQLRRKVVTRGRDDCRQA